MNANSTFISKDHISDVLNYPKKLSFTTKPNLRITRRDGNKKRLIIQVPMRHKAEIKRNVSVDDINKLASYKFEQLKIIDLGSTIVQLHVK